MCKLVLSQDKLDQNLQEYLQLATTSQLLQELRQRPKFPHVLIHFDANDEYFTSFVVESHNLSNNKNATMLETLRMLYVAEIAMKKEMIKNNIDIPTKYERFESE
jgi:hypothetical protein